MLIKEKYRVWNIPVDKTVLTLTICMILYNYFWVKNNFINIKMSDLGGEKYNDINFGYKIMTLIEKEILPTTFLVNKTK